MKRILHIIGGLDRGGAESFILNAWRNIDKTKYQFDIVTFLPPLHGDKFAYEDELISGGAKIYRIKDNRIKCPHKFENDIARIVRDNHYTTVHSHIDFMSALSLSGALKGGAKHRISHSHNTFNKNLKSPLKALVAKALRKRLNKVATTKLACGENAGQFLYGRNQKFTIIPNGIDFEKFHFNPEIRKKLRKKYNLSNKTKVLLNVGRLEPVKNQDWLIDTFEELAATQPETALFIVGDGSMKDLLTSKIRSSSVSKKVFLLSSRDDIYAYYSLADIFVLPSKFEGVPTVGIEAQTSGLKCFFSTFVPEETKSSSEVYFLPLSRSDWIKELSKDSTTAKRDRIGSSMNKFNINNSVKKLEEIYDAI